MLLSIKDNYLFNPTAIYPTNHSVLAGLNQPNEHMNEQCLYKNKQIEHICLTYLDLDQLVMLNGIVGETGIC